MQIRGFADARTLLRVDECEMKFVRVEVVVGCVRVRVDVGGCSRTTCEQKRVLFLIKNMHSQYDHFESAYKHREHRHTHFKIHHTPTSKYKYRIADTYTHTQTRTHTHSDRAHTNHVERVGARRFRLVRVQQQRLHVAPRMSESKHQLECARVEERGENNHISTRANEKRDESCKKQFNT
jgi:hypothetical protein